MINIPPHCDTMDGPVVNAARQALEKENVNLILPWAPKEAEEEITKAFKRALAVRRLGKEAKWLADYWFFETIVRLHRAGEGAGYTGLKPAGLSVGPVVPRVEKAIRTGDVNELIVFLQDAVKGEIERKFKYVMGAKDYDKEDVISARRYVGAMLDLTLYSHHLYEYIKKSGEHDYESKEGHGEHQH